MDFVLIPEAWMDAWVWEPVTDGLRALGHRAHPITLSGLTGDADVWDVELETHVGDVLSVLEESDMREAIVVGHSYSGIVAGQVADRACPRGTPCLWTRSSRTRVSRCSTPSPSPSANTSFDR